MSTNNHICAICSQIKGEKKNDLLSIIFKDEEKYTRRVILENNDYAIFPSIGPLVFGHTILCPKEHYTSFASIPKFYDGSLKAILKKMERLLIKNIGFPVHIFEHGTDKYCSRVICSITHAHLHLVPTNLNIWPQIQEDYNWERIIDFSISELNEIVKGREYLLYFNPITETYNVTFSENGFESQYFRQVFTNCLNFTNDDWNWRNNPKTELLIDTYNKLSKIAIDI